ncbi:MAG: AAA family ATPase, partial [Acidobacteria bacterium]|nr:AAA family ATPase [Acidobacteriota bacterium]
MILRRLEVTGFRCFSSRVRLDLKPDQINILHGKNGSGKSSLLWALVRGLLDTYRAGGKSVEALRPWGTDLGPAIQVEFEHTGKIYRLEKRFLEKKGALLEEIQGGRSKPLAEDEKAQERVREILLSDEPTVGLTKPEQWGLAHVLWCPQDHLRVDGFDGRALGSIQELLGKQAMNKEALNLRNEVEESFHEYWTDTGKPKGGQKAPLWVKRESDLALRNTALAEAERERQDLQSAQETAKTLQADVTDARTRLEDISKTVADLADKVNRFVPLVSECEKLKAQWDAKRAEASALEQKVRRIADLLEKHERAAAELEGAVTQIRAAAEKEKVLESSFARIDESLKLLQGGDPDVALLEDLAEDAKNYVAARQQLGSALSQLEKVRRAQGDLHKVSHELSHLQAPEADTLARLEELSEKSRELKTRLDGALLHVELRSKGERRVHVLQGEPTGVRQLGAADALRVSGSPVVELELEGFGLLKVTGPSQSVADLRQKIGEVEQVFGSLASGFGTTDLSALRARHQQASKLRMQEQNTT